MQLNVSYDTSFLKRKQLVINGDIESNPGPIFFILLILLLLKIKLKFTVKARSNHSPRTSTFKSDWINKTFWNITSSYYVKQVVTDCKSKLKTKINPFYGGFLPYDLYSNGRFFLS